MWSPLSRLVLSRLCLAVPVILNKERKKHRQITATQVKVLPFFNPLNPTLPLDKKCEEGSAYIRVSR